MTIEQAQKMVDLITRNHECVHLHANNNGKILLVSGIVVPELLEVTFLRRDRSLFKPSREPIPSSLDAPNMKDRDDYVLTTFG